MEKRIKADSYSLSSGMKGTLFLAFDFKANRLSGDQISIELFETPNTGNEFPILSEQVKRLIAAEYLKWEQTWKKEKTE
jgi:hypothetical protein